MGRDLDRALLEKGVQHGTEPLTFRRNRSQRDSRGDALFNGRPVSWGFNPKEKRVILTFPKMLGGETYTLYIAGYYTFVAHAPEREFSPGWFSTDIFRRGACALKQVFSRSTA